MSSKIERAAASLHDDLTERLGDRLVTVGYDERLRLLIVYLRSGAAVESPYKMFRVETRVCGRVRPARGN